MTNTPTHRERLQACLAGELPPDRPPVALWRHFPVDDQNAGSLAASTLEFQAHYDFDLVKVTPASSFSIKDWGAEDTWEGHSEGTRRYTRRVIQVPGDWEKLKVLDPGKAAHLARQLECLESIKAGLDGQTPILQTVFSPLAQAKNLAGGNQLIEHIRQHPEAVAKGLQVIAETTTRFIEACANIGIDGIFYAVQHAQSGLLSRQEFRDFGLSIDLPVLEAARGFWCNLLHLHGENVYFDLSNDYQCQIVNWHDRETTPSLLDGMQQFQGTVCGGISQHSIVYKDAAEVKRQALDAIQQTGSRRFILGTGCVVPVIAPAGNLRAARHFVEP